MRLKVYCCVFLTTCTGALLASEVTRQEDATMPILVATQTELGLVKNFAKEAISLQKQTLLVQGATLAKTTDILAQEKLQIAAFDKSINVLRLEQSSAERSILSAISFLGVILFLLILRLCLPLKKRPPLAGTFQPTPQGVDSDNPSSKMAMEMPIVVIEPLSERLITGDDSSLEEVTPKIEADGELPINRGLSIVNITVEKATPFFDESSLLHPLTIETLSNDVSEILVQAEKIRQECLEKISHPQQQHRIPPINLALRYPNTPGAHSSSIKEKIIRGKIYSLRGL